MNQKRAKSLRKLLFKDKDFRERAYFRHKESGQITNRSQVEEFESLGGKVLKLPRRLVYQHFKKALKQVPRKLFSKVIFIKNENTKSN